MLENKKLLIGIGAGVFVLILAIVLIVVMSGKKDPNGGKGVDPSTVATVTMWTPINDVSAFKEFQDQLNDKNIILKVVQKDPATYLQDVVDVVASGGGPDIFYMKNDWMPKYHALLKPSALIKSEFSDSALDFKKMYPKVVADEMLSSDGSIYGFPLSSDPIVMYVNTQLFSDLRSQLLKSESGMDDANDLLLRKYPSTWDDFKIATRLLTVKSGLNITQAGAALGTNNNIDDAQAILYALMLQNGTKFVSADLKTATFNLQQKSQRGEDVYPGTNALQLYTSFADPNSDVYSWNEGMINATDYFIQGKLAMLIGYASKEKYIQQQSPTMDFRVLPIPQVRQTTTPTDYMQYWSMSVNKNSKNSDAAWETITLLLSDSRRNQYLRNTQRSPIVTDDLASAKVTTIEGLIRVSNLVYKPDPLKYDAILLNMIQNVTHNRQPLQASINDASRDATALLN